MKEEILEGLAQAVIAGVPAEEAERLAKEALDKGIDPLEAIDKGLSRGIKIVGEKFETREFFLTDLILAAEVMKSCLKVLEPELKKAGRPIRTRGKVVIGTVAGDIHDIGKNIVSAMLTAAGYDVYDAGVDVPAERFVQMIKELRPDILGLSALLTVTTPQQKIVINALQSAGLRDDVYVIVGGGSVTRRWADEIGADGYGADAMEAVEVVNKLISEGGKKT